MSVPRVLPSLIPIIVKMFPAVRELPIIRGLAIPLMDVEPTSDLLLERALQHRIRIKRNPKKTKDTSMVITVESACDCVERVLSSGKFQKLGVLEAARILQGGKATGENPIAEAMAECFRENVLFQKNPRARQHAYTYEKRPCRGHGFGNIENLRHGNT
jgi:hypothetical protein